MRQHYGERRRLKANQNFSTALAQSDRWSCWQKMSGLDDGTFGTLRKVCRMEQVGYHQPSGGQPVLLAIQT